jgi:TolB-like protein
MCIAASLLLVFLAPILWRNLRGSFGLTDRASTTNPPPTPAPTRQSVAVLGFKDMSDQPEKGYLSTALSEMLTTELQAGGNLRTIPGKSVSTMKRDLSLADVVNLPREVLDRVRSNLGAEMVLDGWYSVQGNGANARVHVELHLQDAVAGQTLLR